MRVTLQVVHLARQPARHSDSTVAERLLVVRLTLLVSLSASAGYPRTLFKAGPQDERCTGVRVSESPKPSYCFSTYARALQVRRQLSKFILMRPLHDFMHPDSRQHSHQPHGARTPSASASGPAPSSFGRKKKKKKRSEAPRRFWLAVGNTVEAVLQLIVGVHMWPCIVLGCNPTSQLSIQRVEPLSTSLEVHDQLLRLQTRVRTVSVQRRGSLDDAHTSPASLRNVRPFD